MGEPEEAAQQAASGAGSQAGDEPEQVDSAQADAGRTSQKDSDPDVKYQGGGPDVKYQG